MENDSNLVTTTDTLCVGAKFDSYKQLCTAITNYKYSNNVDLYTRSLRGLEAGQSHTPKRCYSDALVYSEIDYACKQGGREYKSQSKGVRKIQRSVVLVESAGIMRNIDESINPRFSGLAFFIRPTM